MQHALGNGFAEIKKPSPRTSDVLCFIATLYPPSYCLPDSAFPQNGGAIIMFDCRDDINEIMPGFLNAYHYEFCPNGWAFISSDERLFLLQALESLQWALSSRSVGRLQCSFPIFLKKLWILILVTIGLLVNCEQGLSFLINHLGLTTRETVSGPKLFSPTC